MFHDDHLEYKNSTLQVKTLAVPKDTVKNDKIPQKPKRTTKFDFSGTNYETCTLGHVACLEAMLQEDPELIEDICKQAQEISGMRKALACDDHADNKYTLLKADPEFMARASLFKNLKRKSRSNGRNEFINGNEGT